MNAEIPLFFKALVLQGLVSHSEDHIDMGMTGIGDEYLVAVEHPLVPVENSCGLLCRSIGAGIGLSKSESSKPFS